MELAQRDSSKHAVLIVLCMWRSNICALSSVDSFVLRKKSCKTLSRLPQLNRNSCSLSFPSNALWYTINLLKCQKSTLHRTEVKWFLILGLWVCLESIPEFQTGFACKWKILISKWSHWNPLIKLPCKHQTRAGNASVYSEALKISWNVHPYCCRRRNTREGYLAYAAVLLSFPIRIPSILLLKIWALL